MFLSQEHQQNRQAYKKNTGEDFFPVDFPWRLFHFIIGHRDRSAAEPQPGKMP